MIMGIADGKVTAIARVSGETVITPKERMQLAAQLLQQGKLAEGEREYRAVLAVDPKNFLANYNLGIVCLNLGRGAEAEPLFAESIRLNPAVLAPYLAHAKVLADLGKTDQAIARYDHVLRAEPHNAGAHTDRANALFKQDRYAEALVNLDKALKADPESVPALYNRATALMHLKRIDEALASLDKAIAVLPTLAEAYLFKGNLLRDHGRTEEALAAYKGAYEADPARLDCLNNYGSLLLDKGRYTDALAAFDRILAARPGYMDAMVNRARTLGKLGDRIAELAAFDQALTVDPNSVPALVSRGVCLLDLRRYPEAIASLDKAIAVNPRSDTAYHARGNTLTRMARREEALASFQAAFKLKPIAETLNNIALILRMLGRHEEAADAFTQLLEINPAYPGAEGDLLLARLYCADWTNLAERVRSITAGISAGRNVTTPFQLLHVSDDAALLHSAAKIYAGSLKRTPKPWTPPDPGRIAARRDERLRIAYLSADFQAHATAFLAAGMFEAHDHSKFETIAVSFAPGGGDAMRNRLAASFDQFIDASAITDDDLTAALRGMPVDIAVDLKGFTNEARPGLFLDRLAPLQVNFLGYPGTWGSPCMDYIVADGVIIPPAHEPFYSEKVVRLPDSYQPSDRTRPITERTPTRAELGLPETGFVFCCFNANCKIQPFLFDLWMRLLKQVDGSVLWLLGANPASIRNLKREAEARGVPASRLVFADYATSPDHLARNKQADLFLDTVPCNAHTTANDALWAGLPVLTCPANAFAGRVAASVVKAAGGEALIVETLADYEATALRLTANPAELAAIREKLARERMTCALFDTQRFCRNLEAAFTAMWERETRGEAPASFSV